MLLALRDDHWLRPSYDIRRSGGCEIEFIWTGSRPYQVYLCWGSIELAARFGTSSGLCGHIPLDPRGRRNPALADREAYVVSLADACAQRRVGSAHPPWREPAPLPAGSRRGWMVGEGAIRRPEIGGGR